MPKFLKIGRSRRMVLAAVAAAATWCTPSAAEWSLSFPAVAACTVSRPELPVRWRATGLMLPFYQGQIDVGEFVYDGELPAMRASVYGLESGAADILITNTETYLLAGPHDAPTGCRVLDRKLKVPSTHWLSEHAVCVARTRLGKKLVRLWKTPGLEGRARWHWFDHATRLPLRSLFLSRATDPAIIGDYAMTYFQDFAPLSHTNLAGLHDMCRTAASHISIKAVADTPTARELMAVSSPAAESEQRDRIAALIPGLTHRACARMKPVRWPDRFILTATITPIQFKENPYLSLIYYDWKDAETQLAVMLQGTPPVLKGLVSLKKGVGYRIHTKASSGPACEAVFPGIVRPDWMTAAGCECKGVFDRNSVLSPAGEAQIISCPIKDQGSRIMWNRYSAEGTPLMFMEASPRGGGVMLADYHDWLPGKTGKPNDFELPSACTAMGHAGRPADNTHTLSNPSCSDCHTTAR